MAETTTKKKANEMHRKIFYVIIVFVVAYAVAAAYLNSQPQAPYDKYLSEQNAKEAADLFIRASPTFRGDSSFLDFLRSEECGRDCWILDYQYASTHSGYGAEKNLSGPFSPQVHQAKLRVEKGEVKSLVLDGVWDEMTQTMISSS